MNRIVVCEGVSGEWGYYRCSTLAEAREAVQKHQRGGLGTSIVPPSRVPKYAVIHENEEEPQEVSSPQA